MSGRTPYPKLRPVEIIPVEHEGRRYLAIQDPFRLAEGTIFLSPPGMFVVAQMDGETSPEQIQDRFLEEFGQPLTREQLDGLIAQLDQALFLDSDRFAEHLTGERERYRAETVRESCSPAADGSDRADVESDLAGLLNTADRRRPQRPGKRLVGLIAPHLDYPRGRPCYADAYGLLAEHPPAERYIILGTNHHGMSTSVVCTTKDFRTPLGLTATDKDFVVGLSRRCGVDLCAHELDHRLEHSVELQLVMLQHILGADRFRIVPVLCPDPCGPTGTQPSDGEGIDLRQFGQVLAEMIEEDDTPTVIIAGADLSHIGRHFGHNLSITDEVLQLIHEVDNSALEALIDGGAEPFLAILTAQGNHTQICSAGCIFTLATALPQARRELLRYHQAVNRDHEICVTCCSAVLWED